MELKYRIGDLLVDLHRNAVHYDGESARMTPKAEQLFLMLCRHPNQLIMRQQILEEIWADRYVEEATITNCVWQIRKAIGEQGRAILQTRAKRGYLLVFDPEAAAYVESDAAALEAAQGLVDAVETVGADPAIVDPGSLETAGDQYRSADRIRAKRSFSFGFPLRLAMFALALISLGLLTWHLRRNDATAFSKLFPADSANAELIAAVHAPDDPDGWLRKAMVRTIAEQAHLRGGNIVLLQNRPRKMNFRSPYVQVTVVNRRGADLHAEMRIVHSGRDRTKSFRGASQRLPFELESFFRDQFGPVNQKADYAVEQYAYGVAAEAQFDRVAALDHYRRALAHAPDRYEIKLAMARIFAMKGRELDAIAVLDGWQKASLTNGLRCQIETFLLDSSYQETESHSCERSVRQHLFKASDFRAIIRQANADPAKAVSATDWLHSVKLIVYAHIRLGELQQAELALSHAQRDATDAGWAWAVLDLNYLNSVSTAYLGDLEKSIEIRHEAAAGFYEIGDLDSSLYYRTLAWQMMPAMPGAKTTDRRAELASTIQSAEKIGNRKIGITAIDLLARVQPPLSDEWRNLHERMSILVQDSYGQRERALMQRWMLLETLRRRRYGEVLEGVTRLESIRTNDPVSKTWISMLKVRAFMALDRLDSAKSVFKEMEKQKFDFPSTGGLCHFGWLLVETGERLRAREMLNRCRELYQKDRLSKANVGDIGLLAEARLQSANGAVDAAWPVLRPRIDELLATREPTVSEAASLAALARYSIGMPGVDTVRIRRALAKAEQVSRLDGVDTKLLTEIHMLRWRLCSLDKKRECGQTLPGFAQEDLFEARLAQESVRRR
jgi:DNA-binding winged helix-turn-helix (wHTH) protein